VGSHAITVAHEGDQNFLTATSSLVTELAEDFKFSLITSSVTALPGGTQVLTSQ
jgi:hypothetical protein